MKSLLSVVIVTCLVSGCNSEQSAQSKMTTETAPDTKQQVDPPALVPEPAPKPPVVEVPAIPLEPSGPVDPPKPTLPIFIGEGITTHTHSNHTVAPLHAVVMPICDTTKMLSILMILNFQSGLSHIAMSHF